MHFERRPPPHTVEQRLGHRAVANGSPAYAFMFTVPRARWNDALLRRRRGRALSLGHRGGLCAETATASTESPQQPENARKRKRSTEPLLPGEF